MVLFFMVISCLFVFYFDVVVDIEPLEVLVGVLEVFGHLSDRVLMKLVSVSHTRIACFVG